METVFNVGERVRVLLERCHRAEEGASCRALIAYNNDDNTFDIIYESNSYGLVEEGEVVARRIAPLETFELSSGKSSDGDSNALQEKERGNQLFQVKDFDAAGEYYRRALSMTAPSKPSVGSRVMVLNALGEYVTGTVCNADGGKTIDVIYDEEDSRGEDEEDGILLSRVIHLTGEEDLLHLQVVLFMNLAKVSLKLHRNGWAIRYSSASIGIIKNNKMLLPELSKKLIDAYYFRAKVFLIVNRPGRALADANSMIESGDRPRADALARQIAVHKEQRRREDRKLARDVAKWVESAMEMNAANGAATAGQEDAFIIEDI